MDVDADSALVEMFGTVGAYKCKYIVAVGALAGLTVSMFGSMFPMPRIIYAMAQDGLIFKYSPSSLTPKTQIINEYLSDFFLKSGPVQEHQH